MSKVMARKMATEHLEFTVDDDITRDRGVLVPSWQTHDPYHGDPNKKLLMTKGVHHPNRPLDDHLIA